MENLEKENPAINHLLKLEAILGGKDSVQLSKDKSSQERYTLFITRNPKGGVVVEFLEPGNIHNIFFVDASGTRGERKQLNFIQKEVGKEELGSEISLDDVLRKFEL